MKEAVQIKIPEKIRSVLQLVQMLLKTGYLGDTGNLDFSHDENGQLRKESFCKKICKNLSFPN